MTFSRQKYNQFIELEKKMKNPNIPLKKHKMETRFPQSQIQALREMTDVNRLSVAQVIPPLRRWYPHQNALASSLTASINL